jgi:hypothetical protein
MQEEISWVSHEHKSHHYYVTFPHRQGRWTIWSHFLPLTNEAETFLFRDRRGQNYFVHDWRGWTLDFIMGSARWGRIPLLEADEALALHHFHLFVLMHIHGDNSYLFGDNNDNHRHSLIRGVLRPNTADVINRRPLEAPGTISHTILWLSDRARRKIILKWEIVLCNSPMNE